MATKFVTIHHPTLRRESLVPATSVPKWKEAGWREGALTAAPLPDVTDPEKVEPPSPDVTNPADVEPSASRAKTKK
ncbi:hypothetical protein GCM10010401_14230 [Rarobacter faecitabidus]|uniref:Uncharacterized protein n=1 Tax=Rarobacter faecitabidus TaxID=13243 RepID=A0A542ZE39_RARFA|nr:hypothetical protein [Rarobacter faecitabidus]TQL58530.1 hypothetical protein FB461_1945 [Rarobacter faecitabidus]